jgi:hypothetical protein
MNEFYRDTDVRAVALLPVMLDRRLQATKMTLQMLDKIAAKYNPGVLPAIRTDQGCSGPTAGRLFSQITIRAQRRMKTMRPQRAVLRSS